MIAIERDGTEVKHIMYDIFRYLGRGHEHRRPDRDLFVNIQWENIMKGKTFVSQIKIVIKYTCFKFLLLNMLQF